MTLEERLESKQARIERLEADNARLKRANDELSDTLTRVLNGEQPWAEQPEAKAS